MRCLIPSLVLLIAGAKYANGVFCQLKSNNLKCQLQVQENGSNASIPYSRFASRLRTFEHLDVTIQGQDVSSFLRSDESRNLLATTRVTSMTVIDEAARVNYTHGVFCGFKNTLRKMKIGAGKYPNDVHGNLTRLPDLSCLTNLEILDVRCNKLRQIGVTTVNQLTSLKELLLSSNQIYRVHQRAFRANSNLKTLDLSFNRISKLYTQTFRHLDKLEKLRLSYNKISIVGPYTFDSLTNIREISFTDNRLKTIEPRTFSNLPNLESLYLDNNRILEFGLNAFEELPGLKTLTVDHNKLTALENGIFVGLKNLTKALFGYNDIATIGDRAFLGIPKIACIELWNNRLTKISQKTFQPIWQSLEILDLGDNYFKCNCGLKWIVEIYRNNSSHHPNLIMSCYDAKRRRPYDINEATLKQINCD